jgi:flagellin
VLVALARQNVGQKQNASRIQEQDIAKMASVNTNGAALVALQYLNKTNSELEQVQSRLNTGLKVATAKDDGATYAVAQGLRAKIAGMGVVKNSLDRAVSTVDVAAAAGEAVSDLLVQLKEKALSAKDQSLDAASRTAYNEDFKRLRDQITKVLNNADFNGTNMVKSGGVDMTAIVDAAGASTITVSAEDMSLGGSIVTISATESIGTVAAASAAAILLDASITNVGAALARLGAGSKALSISNTFASKVKDALETGLGNLVDADLSRESARLQSLQVKQQLGIQALSIANQSSSMLLSLFR